MKKHPIFLTLFLAFIILGAGVSVSYYNTKSFGFDEDAVLIKIEDDSVTLLDFQIYFSDVEKIYNETKKYIPKEFYSTRPQLVVDFDRLKKINI